MEAAAEVEAEAAVTVDSGVGLEWRQLGGGRECGGWRSANDVEGACLRRKKKIMENVQGSLRFIY